MPLLQGVQRSGLGALYVRHIKRVPRELGGHCRRGGEGRERVFGLKGVDAALRAEEEFVPRFAPLDIIKVELTVRLVGVLV